VLWSERPDLVRRLAGPALTAAAVGALGAVVVAGQRMGTLEFPVAVVATVVVVAALLTRPASRLADALGSPTAVAVGQRSYGIYLYHWPIFIFLGLSTPMKAVVLGVPLSLAAAWISYALIEAPFLALKRRWQVRPAGEGAALTGLSS
jgi:peptidoglycan/LPS O-acetylase OafA/YrhL